MVLGHDFHSETGYQSSLKAGGEPLTLPTWSNLTKLLATAGLPPERCFFTNLYMGLREGSATTGPFPGAKDPAFVRHCADFFLEQLRAQRPALVLTLGIHVPPVVATLSPELAPWAEKMGLKHLDAVGPVRTNVTFRGVDDFRTTVAALIHPSLRHASLRHRRYKEVEGQAAELRMLHDGMSAAGLTTA
jgi:uracil-DNA glycosylase